MGSAKIAPPLEPTKFFNKQQLLQPEIVGESEPKGLRREALKERTGEACKGQVLGAGEPETAWKKIKHRNFKNESHYSE